MFNNNLKQPDITYNNNSSWKLTFINIFNFNKKSPFWKAVLLFFILLLISCQTLAISHLIEHNFQDKSKDYQQFSSTSFFDENSPIIISKNDKINNCNLCNLANLQKKLISFLILLYLPALINLIFPRKFLLTNITSLFQTKRCRAPPFFA